MALRALYVVDVMPLLYRGHFAFLRNPRITSGGVDTSALTGFTGTVMQILEQRVPTHLVLVFDSRTPTFRHEAYPEYKAQRQRPLRRLSRQSRWPRSSPGPCVSRALGSMASRPTT